MDSDVTTGLLHDIHPDQFGRYARLIRDPEDGVVHCLVLRFRIGLLQKWQTQFEPLSLAKVIVYHTIKQDLQCFERQPHLASRPSCLNTSIAPVLDILHGLFGHECHVIITLGRLVTMRVRGGYGLVRCCGRSCQVVVDRTRVSGDDSLSCHDCSEDKRIFHSDKISYKAWISKTKVGSKLIFKYVNE